MPKHGDVGECPGCDEPGHFDMATPAGQEPEFVDSIWFNTHSQEWECHYCWLK